MKTKTSALAALVFLLNLPSQAAPDGPAEASGNRSRETWEVSAVQAGAGMAAGGLAAMGAGLLVFGMSGCAGDGDDRGSDDDDMSSGYECLGAAYLAVAAGGAGYLIGNSLGIHFTGRTMGRHGGYWSTLLGSGVGMVLGLYAASALEESPVAQSLAMVALSQAAPILFYHLSDRVRATASFAPPPGVEGSPLTLAAMAQGLRPEVKVDLLRF